jgi:AcrR family transcriptional regulator
MATGIAGAHGGLGKVQAALTAGLETFARHRELARILLLESVSLGPAYQSKRLEVHERFASLIQAYLDDAVAEGSIPPLNTRVATLAWLGAVNEVVIQWLYRGHPDLMTEAVPALTPLLLRSIGAAQ